MDRFSIREVVEMAVQTEKLGQVFYRDMAARFKEGEGLGELFGRLADMEVAHEKTFEGLLSSISDAEPEGWDEAQPYFRAMVESEFFLGKGKALPSMDHVKTVGDALDFALGFEKESVLYYMGLRAAVADKATVDKVIDEETSHIRWISGLREKIRS